MDINKNKKIKKVITTFLLLIFALQLLLPTIYVLASRFDEERRLIEEAYNNGEMTQTEYDNMMDYYDEAEERADAREEYESNSDERREELREDTDFLNPIHIVENIVVWLLRFVLGLLIDLYNIIASNFFSVIGNVIYPEGTIAIFGTVYINLGGIIKASSISLIMLMALYKGFNTYVLWKDGSPEENPFEIITRYLFAIAMLFSFDELFSIASEFFMNLSSTVSLSSSGSFNASQVESLAEVLLMIIIMISLIKEIMSAVVGLIGKGIELFIIRIGFPFACISAITPQASGFHNYVLSIIKALFTIVVMQTIIGISMQIFAGGSNLTAMVWSWATLQVATKGGSLISSLVSTGSSNAGNEIGAGAGGIMRGTMQTGRTIARAGRAIRSMFGG